MFALDQFYPLSIWGFFLAETEHVTFELEHMLLSFRYQNQMHYKLEHV